MKLRVSKPFQCKFQQKKYLNCHRVKPLVPKNVNKYFLIPKFNNFIFSFQICTQKIFPRETIFFLFHSSAKHSMPISTLGVRFCVFFLFTIFARCHRRRVSFRTHLLYIWNNMQIEETVFIDVRWFSYFAYQSHCRQKPTRIRRQPWRSTPSVCRHFFSRVNIMSVKWKIKKSSLFTHSSLFSLLTPILAIFIFRYFLWFFLYFLHPQSHFPFLRVMMMMLLAKKKEVRDAHNFFSFHALLKKYHFWIFSQL